MGVALWAATAHCRYGLSGNGMREQTLETAATYFNARGAIVHYFERTNRYSICRYYEALIERRDGRIELWAWDALHGGGFWHFTGA
jgi:hypothetical protein